MGVPGRTRAEMVGRSLVGVTAVVCGVWVLVVVAAGLVPVGPTACARALQLSGDGADLADALAGPCRGVVVRVTLWWDFLLVAVYAAGIASICLLGASRLYRGGERQVARWGALSAAVAGMADAIENAVLLTAIPDRTEILWVSQGAALLKWAALGPALVIAAVVTVTLVVRSVVRARDRRRPPVRITTWPPHDRGSERDGTDGPSTPDAAHVWARNYAVPQVADTPADGRVGLCLSGGGIRSATFALGVTQVLARDGVLGKVDYVAAVSGGGYHAGAQQMLRARGRQLDDPIPLVDAYAPGTPEEDHRRRHGKYVADGAGGWLRVVGVVARNLAFSLTLLYAAILLGARLLGWVYGRLQPWSTPLFELSPGRCPSAGQAFPCAWSPPPFGPGTWLAIAVPLAAAALLWIWSGWTSPTADDVASRTRAAGRREQRERLAVAAVALAGVATALLAVGPLIVRLTQWLAATGFGPEEAPGVGATSGIGALVVTLWNMLARSRATDTDAATPASRSRRLLARAGFATRALLSLAVVAGLGLSALLVLATELERAVVGYLGDPAQVLWRDLRVVIPLTVLVLVGLFFDQTRMSLHPFYKRRLATAFAVERTTDGDAQEFDFEAPTLLSQVATPTSPDGTYRSSAPKLLLCAVAHASGTDLAPPGRRVTPIVFGDEWVGGPRIGYFATDALERAVRGRAYEGDVTTLAAMALSGAAFASAMGRLSGPFNILLAITNTRLGAWLPNPRYHARLRAVQDGEQAALERYRRALPRVRRLPYWLREIVGSYPPDDRFVYISDGGHYENLGLVELLRRGCDTIYCVDASGDAGARALAVAATVAYEELGVRIAIDGSPLVPGQATGDGNDVLARLEGRLARRPVVEGEIHYPDVGPARGRVGRLYVGKAVLTPTTPFVVLAHAINAEQFPSDTTADQWFDSAQFEAYRALGRWVAEQMTAEPAES